MNGTLSEIRMFGPNWAPRSWALCNGQILPINQNQALFSLLGTMYGGDGRTSFGLPDLRGRFATHTTGANVSPGVTYSWPQGHKAGAEDVTLTTAEMPAHNHILNAQDTETVTANTNGAIGNQFPGPTTNIPSNLFYADDTPSATLKMRDGSVHVQLANTGGTQSHTNLMPSQAVSFIICIQGVFPSRN